MIGYINFNANPKNNDTNDCVIRAIAIYSYARISYNATYGFSPIDFFKDNLSAYGEVEECKKLFETYDIVYDVLARLGRNDCLMLNDEKNYQEYLKNKCGLRMKEIKFDKNTIKVKDLSRYAKNRNLIVNLNGHLTVIIECHLIDTFDCREEYVESIFYS